VHHRSVRLPSFSITHYSVTKEAFLKSINLAELVIQNSSCNIEHFLEKYIRIVKSRFHGLPTDLHKYQLHL